MNRQYILGICPTEDAKCRRSTTRGVQYQWAARPSYGALMRAAAGSFAASNDDS